MSHLIRFYSGDCGPTILCREEEGIAEILLEGEEDITFSHNRACIGYRAPDGYHKCANGAINIKQCPMCAGLDMARAYTVGDFTGYPELYERAKAEKYALYLAGFGEEIIKCGVTRKERFMERMREQGADFGCVVAEFDGPDKIYDAEHSLQHRFNFANSVRLEQKMRHLVFDSVTARENFNAAVELVSSSGAVPDFTPEIMDFSTHYPKLTHVHRTDSILGQIQGAKGEILIFRSQGGRDFAMNMRAQVGLFFERKKQE
ncbi:MAG: DUF2797 domain-containing protein [Candidatus Micrarchaeia archaeon]